MNRIEVNASGFKDEFICLNGRTSLNFSNLDLIRAIISIGHSDWRSVFGGGWERILEIIYHITGAINYTHSYNGNFGLMEQFWGLDQSEKTPIIYRLGMGVTKLVAERFLEIPWLLHVDSLINNGIATRTTGSRERGDLAGLDTLERWHVLESKGRSNQPEKIALEKGKIQAGRIQSINNKSPITKSVCLSHFQKKQTIVVFNDPNIDYDIPIALEIDKNNYLLFYYQRILNQLNYENSYTENISIFESEFEFRFFRFGDISFEIGVFSPIVDHIESLNFIETLKEFQIILKENYPENLEYSMSIGLDGIIVRQKNERIKAAEGFE